MLDKFLGRETPEVEGGDCGLLLGCTVENEGLQTAKAELLRLAGVRTVELGRIAEIRQQRSGKDAKLGLLREKQCQHERECAEALLSGSDMPEPADIDCRSLERDLRILHVAECALNEKLAETDAAIQRCKSQMKSALRSLAVDNSARLAEMYAEVAAHLRLIWQAHAAWWQVHAEHITGPPLAMLHLDNSDFLNSRLMQSPDLWLPEVRQLFAEIHSVKEEVAQAIR